MNGQREALTLPGAGSGWVAIAPRAPFGRALPGLHRACCLVEGRAVSEGFEAQMAVVPRPDGMGMAPQSPMPADAPPQGSNLDQAFIADRAMFWGRFTGFIKLGIGAVVVVLLFLLVVVY